MAVARHAPTPARITQLVTSDAGAMATVTADGRTIMTDGRIARDALPR